MKIEIKSTGEILDFEPKTLSETMQLWLMCKEYIEAYTKVKDAMKPMIKAYTDGRGASEPTNGYVFRVSNIQRTSYDKSVMRRVLDEDTMDILLEPSKTAVDRYLKEHLADLGDASTELRQTMVPVGRPYQVIKAEKVER